MTTKKDVISIGAINDSIKTEIPVVFDGVGLFFISEDKSIAVYSGRGDRLCTIDAGWTMEFITSQIRGALVRYKVCHPAGAISFEEAKAHSTNRGLGRFPGWSFFAVRNGIIMCQKDNFNNARRGFSDVEIVAYSPDLKAYRVVSAFEAEQIAIDNVEATFERARSFDWEAYESTKEGE